MILSRFWLIELLSYWDGRINTRPLMQSFGLTRTTASHLLSQYRERYPHNLRYDEQHKAYRPSADFSPTLIDKTVDEYLDWLEFHKIPLHLDNQASVTQQRVHPPKRFVSPLVMRPLIQAVNQQLRVDCEYLSVTSSDPQGRLLSPHTFVKAANRWHVRAYCAMRNEFRDFVLSRFHHVEFDGGLADKTRTDDHHWNQWVTIELAADSRLSNSQQQVLAKDFGMEDGRLQIHTRAALVKYTLDEMQIKTRYLDHNPQAQQLICVNYSDIKQWLYD